MLNPSSQPATQIRLFNRRYYLKDIVSLGEGGQFFYILLTVHHVMILGK